VGRLQRLRACDVGVRPRCLSSPRAYSEFKGSCGLERILDSAGASLQRRRLLFFRARAGLEFLTGYLIEEALSVDNIFVFVLVFSYFQVPAKYQHRVLFWGVLGALLMRGAMIAAGAYLIARFHWILYVFGGFLIMTAIRMATQDEHSIEPEANPVIRLLRRVVPGDGRLPRAAVFRS